MMSCWQQADRLAVVGGGGAFANLAQGLVIVALDAQEKSGHAGLLVEGQNIRIADDVIGPRGADECQRDMLGDECLQESLPGRPGRGRVLIGKVDHFDAVGPMEPGEFGREFPRIAVPPAFPERMLAAVAALVRTAARKLHHDRATISPIAVARQIDEFPAHAKGIEVLDDPGRRRRARMPLSRKAIPGTSPSGASVSMASITRRIVSSPSPRTMTSICGSCARISRQ